jgi:hypothetical protein
LLLYGSVFPDIPMTGLISWEEMKNKTYVFANYLKQNNSKLNNFAMGLLLHEEPFGIDRFVHGENGYAYIKGKEIIAEVEKYFPDDDAATVAHGFIEFAVEIILTEKYPNLQKELKIVLKEINNHYVDDIALLFSRFFSKDISVVKQTIVKYNNLLNQDVSSFEEAVNLYTQLMDLMRKTKNDEGVVKSILEKAMVIIDDNWEFFLEKTIKRCKKDFEKRTS